MKKTILLLIFIGISSCFAQVQSSHVYNITDRMVLSSILQLSSRPATLMFPETKNTEFRSIGFLQSNAELMPFDTIVKDKPKLALIRIAISGGDNRTVHNLDGFMVNKEKVKFGFFYKNLKKYIYDDKDALMNFRAMRTSRYINNATSWISLGTFIPFGIMLINETRPGSFAMLGITSGLMFITAEITGMIARKKLRECVKVYNRNAGYGYINGL
jgi:hypothetical protein